MTHRGTLSRSETEVHQRPSVTGERGCTPGGGGVGRRAEKADGAGGGGWGTPYIAKIRPSEVLQGTFYTGVACKSTAVLPNGRYKHAGGFIREPL